MKYNLATFLDKQAKLPDNMANFLDRQAKLLDNLAKFLYNEVKLAENQFSIQNCTICGQFAEKPKMSKAGWLKYRKWNI